MQPIPAANEAAAPPDEPPGVMFLSQGFNVSPKRGLPVCQRRLNSGVLVLPIGIAPAFRRLSTTGELAGARLSFNLLTPFGLDCPVISTLSFIVTGTPCNGPICSFLEIFSSASIAISIASSFRLLVIAFIFGLTSVSRSK